MATAEANKVITNVSETLVFDAVAEGVDPCTTIRVSVLSGSTTPILVRVPGLHADGEQARVGLGQTKEFRHGDGGLSKLYLQGEIAVGLADYEIAVRTESSSD